MSIDLDDRARRAAAAVHEAVGEARLHLMEEGVPAARAPRTLRSAPRPGWAALAGALSALVVLAGLLVTRDALFAPDTATPPPGTLGLTVPPVDDPTTTTEPTTTSPARETTTTGATTTTTEATTTTLDLLPPALVVTSPSDGHVFTEKVVRFEGVTEPGATVMAGPYEAEVDADGRWSIVLVLSPGDNRARFTATDAAGNESEATVTVRYEPPATEPTTTTSTVADEPAPFVANFTWGECNLDPPYDEYYGTGEPGTSVTVTSEFGEGVTEVGADGTWYVKVFFPTAPFDDPFLVKVRDSLGRQETFEFVRVSA